MEQITIFARCRKAEDILQGLDVLRLSREGFNLSEGQRSARYPKPSTERTILIEASARLINVGATSPSWPAASSAEASHRDKIVPTS